AAGADAAPYKLWCTKGWDKPVVFVVSEAGTAALYVKGAKPRMAQSQEQIVIGSLDELDLRATEVWLVEDRLFHPCKDQKLPDWVKLGNKLDETIQLQTSGIRPKGISPKADNPW